MTKRSAPRDEPRRHARVRPGDRTASESLRKERYLRNTQAWIGMKLSGYRRRNAGKCRLGFWLSAGSAGCTNRTGVGMAWLNLVVTTLGR